VVGGAVATTVAVSALAGTFVGPGVIAVMAVFWALDPPRGVVVTSNSVTVMKRSMLTGKPTTVVEVAHLASALAPPASRSGPWSAHDLGRERVWLTRTEAARMVAAVGQVSSAVQHGAPHPSAR
jgi:hypothetical protein